jgi:hypothetical protein
VENSCLHIIDSEIRKMPQTHNNQKFAALPLITELVQDDKEDMTFQSMRG